MPGKTARVRERPLVAQYVDEHPVTTLDMQPINRLSENAVVVHVA
jgi:hypothetical protein